MCHDHQSGIDNAHQTFGLAKMDSGLSSNFLSSSEASIDEDGLDSGARGEEVEVVSTIASADFVELSEGTTCCYCS